MNKNVQQLIKAMQAGTPVPAGFTLPPAQASKDQSSPDAVTRATGDIDRLKRTSFETWKSSLSDGNIANVIEQQWGWDDMTQLGKYVAMDQWVNWQGVAPGDRLRMMLENVGENTTVKDLQTLVENKIEVRDAERDQDFQIGE